MLRRAAAIACLAACTSAAAQDESALALADALGPDKVEQAAALRAFVEGGLVADTMRGGATRHARRASLDLQYEQSFGAQWSVNLANRLDVRGSEHTNTFKEGYASWRPAGDMLFDLGRINVRNGVATGYNPTDYFRVDALRSVVSIDPASLRENRAGSTMLRAQTLWTGGAATLLRASEDRWLLAISQKLGGLTPQWLVYHERAQAPQFGLNLTALVNDATVAHLEWSGGRRRGQVEEALQPVLGDCRCASFRHRVAAGATVTTEDKLSLTAELHYNGAAPDRAGWDALRHGPLALAGLYAMQMQRQQELPTRRELFFHARWQDALVHHLDLSAMLNHDLADRSRRAWLEARYRADRVDYVLQWQRNLGDAASHFGVLPQTHGWQAALRYYF